MLLLREFRDKLNGNRGPIDAPMARNLGKAHTKEGLLALVPLGRFGQPEEVAELICWLLCDRSSYVSGTIQSIDGDWAS
jgi:NAD(P)-dependent dehydrogenase (short-subunit alcohol dehydrogenase family)